MFILKKIKYNSPVILTFALLSLTALVSGYITGDRTTWMLFCVYRGSLSDPLFYFRLLGHVLGHAGTEHFFNNFMIILLLGPMLEEKYGSRNIAILIVTTALITGILHVLMFDTALLGASGVVFMMILLSSFANYEEGKIPVTLILAVVIFIGREIYDGFLIEDNISRITHVIGGICGGGMGFVLNRKRSKQNEL